MMEGYQQRTYDPSLPPAIVVHREPVLKSYNHQRNVDRRNDHSRQMRYILQGEEEFFVRVPGQLNTLISSACRFAIEF